MKLFGLCFSALWILCCCCLVYVRGHNVCTVGKLSSRINLTTELQSEILLSCLFEQALIGSDLTVNSSAVWTQIKETIDYIVEIKVNGHEGFWNNRRNRISVFRDASGNFSILIRDVQLSDLGLYRCQLYRDVNCLLGFNEIEISLAAVEFSLLNDWQLIVAGGGGFLLLCLISVCVYYTLAKRQTVDASIIHTSDNCHDVDGQKNDDITYASVVPKSRNCHDSEGQNNDEITYVSVVPKSHNCHDSEEQKNDEITYASVVLKSHNSHDSEALLNNNPLNSSSSGLISIETVLYATVKQGERR